MGNARGEGPCEVWVEINTEVTDTHVKIKVEGGPGHSDGTEHIWSNLEIVVKARDTSTGSWVTKFSISPILKVWNGSFPKSGYSVYSVSAKSFDEFEGGHRGRATAELEEAIPMGATGAAF